MNSSESMIMHRLITVSLTLLFIITLTINAFAISEKMPFNPCLKCHEDVYVKAVSYRYQHSVVREQCTLCHLYPEAMDMDNVISQLNFPTLQREWLVYLDRLSEDQVYMAEIIVADTTGKRSTPITLDILPKNLWETDGQRTSLKLSKLSRVMLTEVRRLGFAGAVISWDTDVFATSEIEYRMAGDRSNTFRLKDLYTKAHMIVLDGLKQKSRYWFRVVSRDVYGNTLKSEEYSFDTSEEFSRPSLLNEDDLVPPSVEHMTVFRSAGDKGLYLKVSANKACVLSVNIKEVKKMDEKHGPGLLPARYSRIDVCLTCHPHDSSHPVGVKAVSPKIHAPDGLPTIENGIITCVTCHNPHGGELAYFNRFDYRKDLCMRCHLQKYST